MSQPTRCHGGAAAAPLTDSAGSVDIDPRNRSQLQLHVLPNTRCEVILRLCDMVSGCNPRAMIPQVIALHMHAEENMLHGLRTPAA